MIDHRIGTLLILSLALHCAVAQLDQASLGTQPKKERVVAMVKYDGIVRGLVGKLISMFEEKGLKLVAAKYVVLDDNKTAALYYRQHDKPYFPAVQKSLRNTPAFASIWEGFDLISKMGSFKKGSKSENLISISPELAQKGIRADFGITNTQNTVHITDVLEDYQKEADALFSPGDYVKNP